jgi:ABC-2 type transport system ATP-binding protein
VSFEVRAGGATALLGRNGAGKSTTMRVSPASSRRPSGLAEVAGIDVAADPLEAKRRSGYCPDVGGLIPRATPWEHLQLSARLRGPAGLGAAGRALLEQFDLAARRTGSPPGFSHGMGRRMSVALAVFHEPPVLLLDEPFDGVDPTGVDATLEAVADAAGPRGRGDPLDPPARPRCAGLRPRGRAARAGWPWPASTPTRWPAKGGARAYRALLG